MFSRQALPINFSIPLKVDQYRSFKIEYEKWIYNSKYRVAGLPGTPVIVSGITDAFNQLYGLYNTIGIFKGEYGYHQLVNNRVTFNLSKADCIVVSHPFSADGNDSSILLRRADELDIPIFVDCAFFGVCSDIDFDFSKYKNIHSVCFSLSKTFGTGLDRVGMLFTKDDFPAKEYENWRYPLVTQAALHLDLIKSRSADWAVNTYREKQLQICKEYDLYPSNTLLFGLDYTTKYQAFNRGDVNRVCISALLNDKVRDVLNDLD